MVIGVMTIAIAFSDEATPCMAPCLSSPTDFDRMACIAGWARTPSDARGISIIKILPLVKKDGLSEKAKEIFNDLKSICNCAYDEKDSIGKRYRRNDALGTPFCITVDYESIEDNSVTVRERDSMNQERIKISELFNFIDSKVNMNLLFWN